MVVRSLKSDPESLRALPWICDGACLEQERRERERQTDRQRERETERGGERQRQREAEDKPAGRGRRGPALAPWAPRELRGPHLPQGRRTSTRQGSMASKSLSAS